MANNPDLIEVIQGTLVAFLLGPADTQFGFGLTAAGAGGASAGWPAFGVKKLYPVATVVNVLQDTEDVSPFVIDDASGVTAGSVLMQFAVMTAKLQLDFWCNSKQQRTAIQAALQRAFRQDPRRSGLFLSPATYWGVPISFNIASVQQKDDEASAHTSAWRLMVMLDVETAVVQEVAASAPLATDSKNTVSTNTANPNLTTELSSAVFPLGVPT